MKNDKLKFKNLFSERLNKLPFDVKQFHFWSFICHFALYILIFDLIEETMKLNDLLIYNW